MSDAPLMENLTERQQSLLISLIREYIASSESVSSGLLAQKVELRISSATVRNEMAVLEEKGYIRSLHTSSGRVPTEEGYRFFVKHLIEHEETLQPVETLKMQMAETPLELDSWMQTAVMLLSQETQIAALVTEPRLLAPSRFKHLQVISVQGRMVLMVLVLTTGHVHQQMLMMAEPVTQPVLSQASDLINRYAFDKDSSGLYEAARAQSNVLARELCVLAADALQQMDDWNGKIAYQTGLGDLLPTLEEQGVKQALKVLEGDITLTDIVGDLIHEKTGAVRVIVAGEGRWESLSNLSMVLGRYGTQQLVGAIGVVGPTRMSYGKAIPAVSHVANVISQLLDQLHESTSPVSNDTSSEGQPE